MPIGDLLAQITGQSSLGQKQEVNKEPLPLKRKPDAQLQKSGERPQKARTAPSSSLKRGSASELPSTVNTNLSRMKLGPGASPVAKTTSPLSQKSQANAAPGGPPKPLKKGSYAEIMARGKAAHATLGHIGKIQHKKIEKQPKKRERDAQRAQSLHKNLTPSKLEKSGQSQVSNSQSRGLMGKLDPVPEKKVKKAATATTGYAGTARPKPSSRNPPSRASVSSSAVHNQRGRDERRGPSESKYHYASEEDEDRESEYYSDLSDMEAAAFEVDEEEETAAKIARREDAEALAEENRLKREKEEKRKRLAAMAKSRGGRSY